MGMTVFLTYKKDHILLNMENRQSFLYGKLTVDCGTTLHCVFFVARSNLFFCPFYSMFLLFKAVGLRHRPGIAIVTSSWLLSPLLLTLPSLSFVPLLCLLPASGPFFLLIKIHLSGAGGAGAQNVYVPDLYYKTYSWKCKMNKCG